MITAIAIIEIFSKQPNLDQPRLDKYRTLKLVELITFEVKTLHTIKRHTDRSIVQLQEHIIDINPIFTL